MKPRPEPERWRRTGHHPPYVDRLRPARSSLTQTTAPMPCGRKRKRHKIATHKRKKRLRKNRHKKKGR